jgi:hypothetical protein
MDQGEKIMNTLTTQQLKQIAETFGLTFVKYPEETLPVRDGIVMKGDKVWWRANRGPELVVANDHRTTWTNIRNFPELYQIEEPTIEKIIYKDED